MSQPDDHNDKRRIDTRDAAIWRQSCLTEIGDEAERLLDLAGYADGRVTDGDDIERVESWLAADPDAAADVVAAKALAEAPPTIAADTIVTRAAALVRPRVADAPSVAAGDAVLNAAAVIPFAPSVRLAPSLFQRAARWGSLAAALLVASWLGFTLGSSASLNLVPTAQVSDDSFFGELLDPATGVLRNLTDGLET